MATPMEVHADGGGSSDEGSEGSPAKRRAVVAADAQPDFSPELLQTYYSRLFPYEGMVRWLAYGNDPDSKAPGTQRDFYLRREWSFTLPGDIYLRYQCFRTAAEMKAALLSKRPEKIDIGAVFTCPPKDHNTVAPSAFRTVERELVFDIDLTDYDGVRTCCSGARICRRCWSFMSMAIEVLDAALREDFGFRHLLFVYSGRRGVHCWVCDPAARALTNEARAAVVDYLSVATSGADAAGAKSDLKWPPHPSLARAYSILERNFEEHIVPEAGQGLFASQERWEQVLATLPVESLAARLRQQWARASDRTDAGDKWRELCAQIADLRHHSGAKKQKLVQANELELWKLNLVFHHTYPRLDENVSKMQNHLLKSPFCVHPKTGRVCVPIDPTRPHEFDPMAVPTVGTLCQEINAHDAEHRGEANTVSDIDKTSMQEPLAYFESAFLAPLHRGIRRQLRDDADQAAAATVDF